MSRPTVVPIGDLANYRKKFLTPAQLADYCCVSRYMIYNHIRKGALPASRIGGVVRIRRSDALAYVGESPAKTLAK